VIIAYMWVGEELSVRTTSVYSCVCDVYAAMYE